MLSIKLVYKNEAVLHATFYFFVQFSYVMRLGASFLDTYQIKVKRFSARILDVWPTNSNPADIAPWLLSPNTLISCEL